MHDLAAEEFVDLLYAFFIVSYWRPPGPARNVQLSLDLLNAANRIFNKVQVDCGPDYLPRSLIVEMSSKMHVQNQRV